MNRSTELPGSNRSATENVPGGAFSHTWRFAGNEAEREVAPRIIEEVTGKMNIFLRGLARKNLLRENTVAESIVVEAGPSEIQVVFSNWESVTTPADGEEIPYKMNSGRKIRISQRIEGNRLIQRMVERGVRTNTLVLHEDGKGLTLEVHISAGLLPDDIRYSLTYAR